MTAGVAREGHRAAQLWLDLNRDVEWESSFSSRYAIRGEIGTNNDQMEAKEVTEQLLSAFTTVDAKNISVELRVQNQDRRVQFDLRIEYPHSVFIVNGVGTDQSMTDDEIRQEMADVEG